MSYVNVTAVIVTYGNRFNLVRQVISAAFEEGVSQIVLVDNASVEETQNELDKLIDIEPRLTLIRNSENLGSAGGFHSGLSYVLENLKSDFIWLLDDDNVPQKKALKNLLNARELIKRDVESFDVVVYSYRGALWEHDRLAVTDGYIKGYEPNNFMGFNFFSVLKEKFNKIRKDKEVNYPIVRSYVGPYGGMLLTLNVLKKIGLPNKEFYLYADDHEFSLRFEKSNIQQYLVYASELADIDCSFPNGNSLFGKNYSDIKLFYGIRNHVFLSRSFVESGFLYRFNKIIYILSMILKSTPYLIKDYYFYIYRIKIIFRAISDGESGRLGKTF